MLVRIGSIVTAELFGGTEVTGKVINIEICKSGEKYGGRVVKNCDLDKQSIGVIDLDNGHWCYFYQVKKVEENSNSY